MPAKRLECPICHFARTYVGDDWKIVCGQVANDFLFPLCKRCFLEYERGVTESANLVRRSELTIQGFLGRWV